MEIIIYIAIFLFSLRTVILIYGGSVTRKKSTENLTNNYQPFVSVIVPARNEEKNIENAVNFLSNSDYPIDKFEIIAVDDRSSDKTPEILNLLKEKVKNLKVVNVKEANKESNLKGKAGALDNGIKQARGELIMMTDADCEVNPKWISTIVNHFSNPKVEIISSYTNIKGNRIFDKIQSVQWVYLQKMASSGPTFNFPLGCFGTNLSIRHNTYKEIGGYGNIPFSVTEDYALLKAVMKRGGIASYLTNPDATVATNPSVTFTELVSQLRRWSRGGFDLKWVAFFFVLSSVAVWSGLIISLVIGNYPIFATLLLIRLFGDFLLISPSLIGIGKSNLIKWTIPAVAFFLMMELLIPPLMLNTKIQWKGQIFK